MTVTHRVLGDAAPPVLTPEVSYNKVNIETTVYYKPSSLLECMGGQVFCRTTIPRGTPENVGLQCQTCQYISSQFWLNNKKASVGSWGFHQVQVIIQTNVDHEKFRLLTFLRTALDAEFFVKPISAVFLPVAELAWV